MLLICDYLAELSRYQWHTLVESFSESEGGKYTEASGEA